MTARTSSRTLIARNARRDLPAARTRRWASPIYLAPLVLVLIACSVSLHQADVMQVSFGSSTDTSPERKYVFGVIYALAVVLCLSRFREAAQILRSSWPYLILLAFMALSAFWSTFPVKVMIGLGHSIGFMAIVLTAVMAMRGNVAMLFRATAVTGLLIMVASLVAVAAAPTRGIMNLGGTLRWVGISPHPNTLGLAALVTAWASTAALFHVESQKARIAYLAAIALSAIALYGANSVTAAVLGLFAVCGMPMLVRVLDRDPSERMVLAIGLCVLLLLAAFAINLAAPEIVASETFLRIVGRSATLTGRTQLWDMADTAIRAKPMLGWSFDGLMSLNARASSQIVQFHNGYLDVLVRGGWIGLSIVFWLIALTCLRLLRLISIEPRIWAPLATLFFVVLLHNVTEASLAQSPSLMWLLITLLLFVLPVLSGFTGEPPLGVRQARRWG